jgi:hypothetical protein
MESRKRFLIITKANVDIASSILSLWILFSLLIIWFQINIKDNEVPAKEQGVDRRKGFPGQF